MSYIHRLGSDFIDVAVIGSALRQSLSGTPARRPPERLRAEERSRAASERWSCRYPHSNARSESVLDRIQIPLASLKVRRRTFDLKNRRANQEDVLRQKLETAREILRTYHPGPPPRPSVQSGGRDIRDSPRGFAEFAGF
jgi:hypothetical protein